MCKRKSEQFIYSLQQCGKGVFFEIEEWESFKLKMLQGQKGPLTWAKKEAMNLQLDLEGLK